MMASLSQADEWIKVPEKEWKNYQSTFTREVLDSYPKYRIKTMTGVQHKGNTAWHYTGLFNNNGNPPDIRCDLQINKSSGNYARSLSCSKNSNMNSNSVIVTSNGYTRISQTS